MFIAALFTIAKTWKQSKTPSTDKKRWKVGGWLKKTRVCANSRSINKILEGGTSDYAEH